MSHNFLCSKQAIICEITPSLHFCEDSLIQLSITVKTIVNGCHKNGFVFFDNVKLDHGKISILTLHIHTHPYGYYIIRILNNIIFTQSHRLCKEEKSISLYLIAINKCSYICFSKLLKPIKKRYGKSL